MRKAVDKVAEKLRKAEYYQQNKSSIDNRCKQYTSLNKEKVLQKNRKHYKENKEEILRYQKSIRHTPKRKYGQARKSAKERNLEWTITFEEYISLISNPCHYCNSPLKEFGGSSLDRIDNAIGYILTNVLPCCGTCNNIRNKFLTVKEMEVAMQAIIKFRKEQDVKS